MPTGLKLAISVLVLLVAGGVYSFEQSLANETLAWVAAGLGIFMVIAIWIFPETSADAPE